MTDDGATPAPVTPRRHFWVLMAVALLSVVLLGSVRFGRADRVGVLTRTGDPITVVTATGRTIERTVVDERQYLSMVMLDRGAERSEIVEELLYRPFVDRPLVPWLAARLPIDDEAFALGAVNLFCSLIGVAAVLLALRRSSASDTAVWIVGLLVAVNWNILMFAGGVLIDPVVFAFMAVGWWLLVSRREWWVIPLMLVAYPLKETTLLFGVVLAAWVWREYAARRIEGLALVGAAAIASLIGIATTQAGVEADASWDMGIKLKVLVENQHVLNLLPMALAVLPVALPAFWRVLQLKRVDGWAPTLTRPDVVGLSLFAAVTLYTWISHDLSPRLFFIGVPFAAWLAVQWFDSDAGRVWADRIRSLPFADRVIPPPPLGAQSGSRNPASL